MLSRRGRPLPRLDNRVGHMALRPSVRSVANISVDGGLVEEMMSVGTLLGLLRSVRLLLVRGGSMGHWRSLILGRSVRGLKGSRTPDAHLGEGQARMGAGSRLPQGRHDEGDDDLEAGGRGRRESWILGGRQRQQRR